MINSIEFENFRGFKHLQLQELSPITLLTGRNNAGKSSILEGIFLFMDHSAPESFAKINSFRGIVSNTHPSSLWEPAFYRLNTNNPMCINTAIDGKACKLCYERDDNYLPVDSSGSIMSDFGQFTAATRSTFTLKYSYHEDDYSENGFFSINDSGFFKTVKTSLPNNQIRFLPPTRFVNPSIREDGFVATWLGQLELNGQKEKLISLLKIIEPDISDITTISNQGQIQLYVKVNEHLLPARLAGDGFNRLLYFLLMTIVNHDLILLIDEIDTGFHYSVLQNVWSMISTAAKQNNCQVIATTHSYECIQSALNGISDANMYEDFCLYRVERTSGESYAFQYDSDLARFAVESNMEVR